MIWKEYKFKGEKINKQTLDWQIWLTLVNWRKIETSDEQSNILWNHWVRTSPTFARWRLITIEWVILANTKENQSKAMDFLDNLFALQTYLWTTEKYIFSVVDEQNRIWNLETKIKNPIEYELFEEDYIEGSDRKFRVVLFGDDPRFFGEEEYTQAKEFAYWGFKMNTNLWRKFNDFFNEIICISSWNIWSPCRIEIEVKKSIEKPLKIINLKNKQFIWIDENFVFWDKIIIDTKKYTITKNGESIKNKRITGSSWLMVSGITKFWVYDTDWWFKESDFDVKIYFNNVLL